MRPDFRPLAGPRALTMRETASGCVKDEIGKICSQTSRSAVALQPRPVKNPVSAFSHNQDPQRPWRVAGPLRCGNQMQRTLKTVVSRASPLLQWVSNQVARFYPLVQETFRV